MIFLPSSLKNHFPTGKSLLFCARIQTLVGSDQEQCLMLMKVLDGPRR